MSNKSKKTKYAWAKYGKRYRKEWEKQPELKVWIQPVVGDDSKAMCKFCKCEVRAHHGDLVQHASTAKHKKSSKPCSSMRLTDIGVSRIVRGANIREQELPLSLPVVPSIMEGSAGTSNVFDSLEKCLIEECNVKEGLGEEVRKLEQVSRQIATILQTVHQKRDDDAVLKLCAKARPYFKDIREGYQKMSQKIPEGDYYKYLSQWQGVSNKLCFLASLIVYFETGSLATREDVMGLLGVQVDRKRGFHIDLEDYLFGLLCLANELSRLAVNSVICGNYKRPIQISKFVCELESGFKLLNLKNDFLRKKYDGLKYDVKKIEQVVYDLKIRGLVTNAGEDL